MRGVDQPSLTSSDASERSSIIDRATTFMHGRVHNRSLFTDGLIKISDQLVLSGMQIASKGLEHKRNGVHLNSPSPSYSLYFHVVSFNKKTHAKKSPIVWRVDQEMRILKFLVKSFHFINCILFNNELNLLKHQQKNQHGNGCIPWLKNRTNFGLIRKFIQLMLFMVRFSSPEINTVKSKHYTVCEQLLKPELVR